MNRAIDTQLQNIEVIDASNSTSGILLNLSIQTEALTIKGGANADNITGGTIADIITGGAGNDLFKYADSGQTGNVATGVVDRIADFATTADDISGLGITGTATGEFSAAAGITGNTYAQALTAANAVFAAANSQSYFMTSFGTDSASAQGILFLNMDNNGTAEGAILIGLSGQATSMSAATALLVAGDIVA